MKLPHLEWVNQDSPYLRQHQQGFRALGFDGELEQAFKRYHANVFLRRMRWALLVAMLLALLFVVLDAIGLPDPLRGRILALRLGLMQPLLLLAWLATYRRGLRDHLQLIGGIVALVCGLAVAGIIGLARYHGFALPYEGIILVTVFFYFLTGLRCTTAVLCGWLTFLAYLAVELSIGLAGELLLSNALFLALANIIGSVGCYSLEYATRQNFLAHGLLQDLAEKDFLTGLLNRRAFTERAERSWRQAQREKQALGVVMMDVDFFKRYNDHYGHAAGDEALRQVARVIGEHARRPLDCTARYGGEEFVGLWYGLGEDQLLAILEDIRSAIEALGLSHACSDAAGVVTLSIGMAYLTPQPHQSLSDTLRLADVALYLAKEQGRNRVVGKRQDGQVNGGKASMIAAESVFSRL
ncbi:GGDEF domain-containing protein [Pseudomonas sp. MMS21-TM103]|uniref:GGDEF domain-containing protein n=1 Tax=Pseudomonas sp. MMS21 TM103 TaxID=2886506 RepID=UPI001EDDC024|nr:GGDEF domain-containing protein [Pseudomonas sp. MMS21 TM103]